MDLLDSLNPAQREAVEYIDGPSLVIAGAGSGKTRVLTHKIAYLLKHGMAPFNILALTFTNKAAREMKQRIASLVGDDRAQYLWMGTFHSIAARILRIEADVLGFNPQFTIYDAADSLSLVKTVIREMGLDEKVYVPRNVAAVISRAKERLMLPSAYQNDRKAYEHDSRNNMPLTGKVYAAYQSRLRNAGAMDFDDLLLYTYILYKENPEVRRRYAERFHFVLVDEYQDTNYAQHAIVWQLTQDRRRVCVVGDDAQSIYSFRGADIENILHFQDLYGGARLFKLEQNYRSTQMIVGAASSLIANNKGQIPKDVFSKGEVGEPLVLLTTYSDIEEAEVVVRKIDTLHRSSYGYGSFAILYRTNFQSRSFEEALRKGGVPYRIYGGLSFYQRKEIKDVIAYCRLAVNPNDEEALRRVINYPARGIGATTLQKLGAAASENDMSMWQALCEGRANVNKGTQAKLDRFAELMLGIASLAAEEDASMLMQKIVKASGMEQDLKQGREPEDEARRENVKELLRGVELFVKQRREEGGSMAMADYLQEVSLLSDMDEDDSTDTDKVTLMTVHSAKGLEFPVVFVVGMEEELFPSARCIESPRAIEEERRLCYVAITRAMNMCFLTNARSRFKYGQSNMTRPSRFIEEIDPRFLRRPGQKVTAVPAGYKPVPTGFRPAQTANRPVPASLTPNAGHTPMSQNSYRPLHSAAKNAPSASAPVSRIQVGQRVEHARFGRGVVEALNGEGIDLKATVRFENMGVKMLLLRFAQLKILC